MPLLNAFLWSLNLFIIAVLKSQSAELTRQGPSKAISIIRFTSLGYVSFSSFITRLTVIYKIFHILEIILQQLYSLTLRGLLCLIGWTNYAKSFPIMLLIFLFIVPASLFSYFSLTGQELADDVLKPPRLHRFFTLYHEHGWLRDCFHKSGNKEWCEGMKTKGATKGFHGGARITMYLVSAHSHKTPSMCENQKCIEKVRFSGHKWLFLKNIFLLVIK